MCCVRHESVYAIYSIQIRQLDSIFANDRNINNDDKTGLVKNCVQ